MQFQHVPVLLRQTIEGLDIKEDGIYVDGTLGGAGHSSEILKRLGKDGRLIGIDQDEDAIEAASAKIGSDERVTIVKSNFVRIKEVLGELGIDKVDGILLDIGVSSHQFDDRERGFSYHEDAPLDMRMDRSGGMTAADIVNTYPEDKLKEIIFNYGEERFAPAIAKNIVKTREKAEIRTTGELVDIIRASMPEREKNKRGHPARKTFQALRIECNHELDVLEQVLGDAMDVLASDGRLCVITFHSLEDRIVKKAYVKAENPCICPPDFPVCTCGRKPVGKADPHKPLVAGDDELAENPRARSAKLRVFRKF
ncbi:MAG: 16S rRNA (cytosine(1402)-N(4))-methyltransferase RsmH [Eubacterium sp.]|nr:16S rRNA (cytosine(1402)-N(4))-methyltransferase RsmH [Eubacterium sp.]